MTMMRFLNLSILLFACFPAQKYLFLYFVGSIPGKHRKKTYSFHT